MIAKQIIGGGFRGALEYLRHGSRGSSPERGEVLDTNLPVANHSPRAFAASFGAFRKLNPRLGRPVYHVSLSPAPGDEISDDHWREIARIYLDGMGFTDCAFVLIKHDEEAEGEAVRPPHIHILASRIRPDSTTVSDQNNYRRSEKLVRDIEARFGLAGVASPKPKKPRRTDMKTDREKRLAAYATERLEEAATAGNDEALLEIAPDDLCSIELAGTLTASERRDIRREILESEYRRQLQDLFVDSIRFVRRGRLGLTLHFKSGGRVLDSGDKVAAFAMPAKEAADALIELAILKGWPSIVLNGNDAFLRAAFALAIAKGLTVQPRPHQLQIFTAVQREKAKGAASAAIAPPAPPVQAAPSFANRNPFNLQGRKGMNERLRGNRDDCGDDTDSAPVRPRGPRM